MSLNFDRLMNFRLGPITTLLTPRDTILYALGIGYGYDPLDEAQLRFVNEKTLLAAPTMAVVVGAGPWLLDDPEFGVTRTGLVHGEQGFSMHRPMPGEGPISVETRVTEVIDKGAGKGALVVSETTLTDPRDQARVATISSTSFCRADGGFDGPRTVLNPTAPATPTPERAADIVCDLPTVPQAALIYRLAGDYHALHIDPQFARAAGFDRPILHGRCTFGIAGHALLRSCCDYDPSRLEAMACRFSAPVYPGETVRTEIWRDRNQARFRSSVPARGVVVLTNGQAEIRGI